MTPTPKFSVLDQAACESVLASQHVGRMAYTFRDRVDIEPLHYVFADGWLYGRTAEGTKLRTLAHHPWVAFEVDAITGLFDWKSVVVRGRIEFPDPERSTLERAKYDRAVEGFRRLIPESFSEKDPTPSRDVVWALPLHSVDGRMATTSW